VVLGALAFEWMQRETHGWFAFNTIWATGGHSYSFYTAISVLQGELRACYFLAVLALALVYYARSRPDLWFPCIYLGTTLLCSLMVGKVGAATNYFLEWHAALCLCGGMAYHLLRTNADERNTVWVLVPAALAALVMVNIHRPNPPAEVSGCGQAYAYVKAYRGTRILSENVGAVVMAGKRLLIVDPFAWTHAVLTGELSDAEVVQMIRSRQADLIVLGSDVEELKSDPEQFKWPRSVVDAIDGNYRLTNSFACQDARFTYQPRPQP
jgi:nucleotide-binding universal stress UspA family protein